MALITAIQRLLPRGPAFNLVGDAKKALEGIADNLELAKDFLGNARSESIPQTAVETLEDWHSTLGLEYDAMQTVAQRQDRVASVYTSIGGQSRTYIDAQLKKQFAQITISEGISPFTSTFYVTGNVTTTQEYKRLLGLIARLVPAHLVLSINVVILSTLTVARCGIAMTGRALTGKIE